jgi:hypothetical protein
MVVIDCHHENAMPCCLNKIYSHLVT